MRPMKTDARNAKPLNRSLHAAKASKQDEFYTQLSDIEKELRHHTKHFKGKTVLCNCDDPRVSNFFKYFLNNFEKLRLKKLITTCHKNQQAEHFSKNDCERGVYFVYSGEQKIARLPDPTKIKPRELKGDGDFRSEECIGLLKEADIVVTNPPFSLFREYVGQLVKYKKKFVIIGNKNAITYKETFAFIKDNRLWLGNTAMGTDMLFQVSDALAKTLVDTKRQGSAYRIVNGEVMARSQSCWFTNLDYEERHEDLALYATYSPEKYPTYDNYDAIEVSKTKDIPMDYDGAMGVPITFLDKFNPEQFEILGWTRGLDEFEAYPTKRYVHPKQVKPDGTESNGGKVNTGPNLLLKKRPSNTYYIAENADGYLEQLYMRIIIKRKN